MTTGQRINVRRALLDAGFCRDYSEDKPEYYDKGDGVYTEAWKYRHDNTTLTLRWDKKEVPA
jgi:hypothetical protein